MDLQSAPLIDRDFMQLRLEVQTVDDSRAHALGRALGLGVLGLGLSV